MKDLAVGIDVEGGGLLVVEGTQALPVSASLLQLDVARDEGDDIRSASDLLNRGFGDPTQSAPLLSKNCVSKIRVCADLNSSSGGAS